MSNFFIRGELVLDLNKWEFYALKANIMMNFKHYIVSSESVHLPEPNTCIYEVIGCGNPSANITALMQSIVTGPSSENFGGWLIVQCSTGYSWTDGFTIKNITCTSIGAWNLPVGCIGLLKYSLINCELNNYNFL